MSLWGLLVKHKFDCSVDHRDCITIEAESYSRARMICKTKHPGAKTITIKRGEGNYNNYNQKMSIFEYL